MSDRSNEEPATESSGRGWLTILLTVGLMLFVFGVVLPQFIDYDAVFRAIGNITAVGWLLLIALGLLSYIPDGWVLQASLIGLKIRQAIRISSVTFAVANIPPGGLELVARFQMSRGFGFDARSATASTVVSWVFTTTSKLLMPVIAVLLLSLDRIQDDDLDFLAILGLSIVLVGAILIAIGLRSTKFVAALGRLMTRSVHFLGRLFKRAWEPDLERGVLELRDETSTVIRSRWHAGVLSGLSGQIVFFLIMLTAVRTVGLGSDAVSFTVIFAAVAGVAAVTTIPIFNTPGINEAIYISVLTAAAGREFSDEIAAAVFVFRLITWIMPIPIGAVSYTRWKKSQGAAVSAEPI